MITVIIAGGSGTRLWPLSTNGFPKHLLKLTNEKSLLQNTLERVSKITSLDSIFVVPEVSHVEHVYEQLRELNKKNILIEPGRRGTASCFIYALSELKKKAVNEQEPILFLWADHLIRDDDAFSATALKAGEVSEKEQKLVFIGVEPTHPSTGFGYIERNGTVAGWQQVYKLASFKEKPNKKTAEIFLEAGNYLWNAGYLVGTVSTFEREIKTHSLRLWNNYNKLLTTKNLETTYLEFESEPIEFALSEKVKDGLVVPGTFDWVDVGSFHDLHEVSGKDEAGNHTRGENIILESVTNSFVRNETETPVAVVGLDNVVVINSPNGVLVVNKNFAQKVGEVAKKIQNG